MTYAAFRSSPKLYLSRPSTANQAARIAWDVLTANGDREICSLGLLDGLWICQLPNGEMDCVEADWVLTQTRVSRKKLQAAIDRRFRQGRPGAKYA